MGHHSRCLAQHPPLGAEDRRAISGVSHRGGVSTILRASCSLSSPRAWTARRMSFVFCMFGVLRCCILLSAFVCHLGSSMLAFRQRFGSSGPVCMWPVFQGVPATQLVDLAMPLMRRPAQEGGYLCGVIWCQGFERALALCVVGPASFLYRGRLPTKRSDCRSSPLLYHYWAPRYLEGEALAVAHVPASPSLPYSSLAVGLIETS